MNPYYFLYYIIYKFLDLNATSETRERVPSVSSYLLLIGLTNYYLSFLLRINLFKHITYSIPLFAIIFTAPLIILYSLNERELIKNKNYEKVKSHFDENNRFKKIHFILMAVLYLFGSIVMMIWSGINYASNS